MKFKFLVMILSLTLISTSPAMGWVMFPEHQSNEIIIIDSYHDDVFIDNYYEEIIIGGGTIFYDEIYDEVIIIDQYGNSVLYKSNNIINPLRY